MNILIEKLKAIVAEQRMEGTKDDVIINIIKEKLQYPVLDFIYNNRAYSHLIMYGGTLLRIAYDLPRMSEDLDFQTDKKFDFKKFEKDLIRYFETTYVIKINVTIKTERLNETEFAFINFPDILEEIGMRGHGLPTVLKIRFDVNTFSKASNFATEIIPKTKDNYVFSMKTYPLSTLMASKVAAVLLRTKRGIENETADCKPRDIYDLEWYMRQKIVPDIEYLKAIYARVGKDIEAQTILDVFDIVTKRVLNLDDDLFERDLKRFFYHPGEYDDWHRNWKERFRLLRNSYEIREVKKNNGAADLQEIYIAEDSSSDNRYFHFWFSAVEPMGERVKFTCILSEYWYIFNDFKISAGHRRKDIEDHIKSNRKLTELDYEYAGLFYGKIEKFLKRSNYVVLQSEIKTKLIRATADKLNVKTQILLDRRLLEKERLEDLL